MGIELKSLINLLIHGISNILKFQKKYKWLHNFQVVRLNKYDIREKRLNYINIVLIIIILFYSFQLNNIFVEIIVRLFLSYRLYKISY